MRTWESAIHHKKNYNYLNEYIPAFPCPALP